MFKISKSSFENHLQQLGYVNCFDVCVPLLQKKETFLTVFLHVILYLCVYAQSLSHVWLFAAPWTIAHQAPPSTEFSRQEYWSGLLFPSPGDLPDSAPLVCNSLFNTKISVWNVESESWREWQHAAWATDSSWGWKPGDLDPSPNSENTFPGDLGHLSFSFCKIGTVIHTGHVPGTVGLVPPSRSASRQAWLEKACSGRRAKSAGSLKFIKKWVIHTQIKASAFFS